MLSRRVIPYLLDLFIVSFSTLVLSLVAGAWTGFPKGNDVYNTLTRTKYILSFFPHLLWNFQWDSGTLFTSHSAFSILPNLIVASVVKLTGWPIEFALNLVATVSACATGIGVYATVLEVTRDRYASVAAALMVSAVAMEGSLWFVWLGVGEYEMFISSAFLVFSILALIRYLKRNNIARLLMAVLCLSLTFQSHVWVAMVAAAAAVSMIFSCVRGLRNMIRNLVLIFLPAILLSSYFYIPLISYRGNTPLTLEALPNQFYGTIQRNAISYLILPLTLILLAFTRLYKLKISTPLGRGTLRSLEIISTLLALHALMYFVWRFIWGVEFWDSLHYLTIFLALISGIAIAQIRLKINAMKSWVRRFASFAVPVGVISIVILSAIPSGTLSFYTVPRISMRAGYNAPEAELIKPIMQNVNETFVYRVGIPDHSSTGAWFSYAYDNPQTGHYMGGLSLHPEWTGWFLVSVWQTSNNYEETDYLLKWFAIKWFIWPHPEATYPNYIKFLDKPHSYDLMGTSDDKKYYVFLFKDAMPIISAVNAPAYLVVGDDLAYGNVFRSLAYWETEGFPPILVRGGKFIDDHTIAELKRFQAVILYGYDYHSRDEAYNLVRQYVEQGGSLIIDTGYSPESTSALLPLPSPIATTQGTDFGKTWRFTGAEHAITTGINFTRFSAAVYAQKYPWGISVSTNESVRAGAQVLLWNYGRPVVVMSELGLGRTIWSGLNLPYHIMTYGNSEESKFFFRMLDWTVQFSNDREREARYAVERPNPQRVEVFVKSRANGILFKESYFEDWHAFIMANGRRTDLAIYRSGPDFMYVPLESTLSQPLNVIFEYQMSNIEWSGIIVSVVTMVVLIGYFARESVRKRRSVW